MIALIVGRAALADLVILGREPHRHDFPIPAMGMMGDLLHRAKTPLFIPGDEKAQVHVAGTALIAWDGSYEAANAVRASLGLLKIASDVAIVQVAEDKEQTFPGTKLLEYLSRHDIHADLSVQDPPGSDRDPKGGCRDPGRACEGNEGRVHGDGGIQPQPNTGGRFRRSHPLPAEGMRSPARDRPLTARKLIRPS